MTATQSAAQPATPSMLPLRARPDQREQWIAHARPIPFEEAAQLVLDAHAADGERDDVVAHDLHTWAFGGSDAMAIAPVPLPGRSPKQPVRLRELAFTQLCQRVGAPPAFIRNLPAKLQVANMNWGITREKQPALLRLGGGEVRAIVSDRYAALDDELVLDVVANVLGKTGLIDDALVRATAVGNSTILRVTIPSEGVAVKRDDIIEYGLDIGNSEVGLRSVQVTPITYRLICTNGMRAWRSEAALRMRHIGDPKRLHDQLRDAVPVALAEARGDIDRWRRATEVLIDSALEEIEGLRTLGLSQGEVQSVPLCQRGVRRRQRPLPDRGPRHRASLVCGEARARGGAGARAAERLAPRGRRAHLGARLGLRRRAGAGGRDRGRCRRDPRADRAGIRRRWLAAGGAHRALARRRRVRAGGRRLGGGTRCS